MNAVIMGVALMSAVGFCFSVFRDVRLSLVFNPDALLIILGGSAIALFVGFPAKRIRDSFCNVIFAFTDKRDREGLIREIMHLAKINRVGGVKELERSIAKSGDAFLKLGVTLLINNKTTEEIRNIMEREMAFRMMNYSFSQNILKTIARLTPSLGLAGTVISLIKMFHNFESVEIMAPFMAVALMSTFYGVVISNLLVLPVSAKVKEKAITDEGLMNITIEGMTALYNREHPLAIEEMLSGVRTEANVALSGAKVEFAQGRT